MAWAAGCGDDAAGADGARDATVRDATAASDAASDASDRDAAVDCDAVVVDVLRTCGAIVCHDPFSGGIGTSLDLSVADALPESLFGRVSSEDCGSVAYLDPEQPDASLLIRKLADDPPCGDRMPAGDRPPLAGRERACFVAWVLAAAERAGASEDAGR